MEVTISQESEQWYKIVAFFIVYKMPRLVKNLNSENSCQLIVQ